LEKIFLFLEKISVSGAWGDCEIFPMGGTSTIQETEGAMDENGFFAFP